MVLDWGEAALAGRVPGADGRPVPGAAVALGWAQSTGSAQSCAERRATTDGIGAFGFSQLGPGPHDLKVSAAGHRPQQQTVQAGIDWTEIRLEPAQ